MDGHEIGFAVQLVEFDLAAGLGELALLHERVGVEDFHAESRRAHRHLARDVAEADQPEGAADETVEGLARRHRPGAGAHLPVVERDLAGAVEQQRHGVLGYLFDAIGRVVGDDDAGGGGGVEVDSVHADAVAGDDAALRHLRHRVGGDRAGVGVEQRVAVRRLGEEFLRLPGLHRHEIADAVEYLLLHVQRFPDVVRQYHFCLGSHACFLWVYL